METKKKEIVIPHVQGNVLKLSIPLDVTKVSVVNGRPEKVKVPYVPVNPVTVFLTCGNYTVKKAAEMDESVTNLAHVEFGEELKCGVYSITVRTKGAHNEPMRFKQRSVVEVFDTTREAGIAPGVEFESEQWILDAAVFFGGIHYDGGGGGEETDPIFSASPAAGITQAIIDYWNAKQEAIGDLGQIRAGAAAGATALQPGALDGYATSDAVNRAIARIQSAIDELMGADDVTEAIDTFREIVAFLDSVEDTETLAGIIAGLNTAIAAKYTFPESGIPEAHLAQAVRNLLALAGTAVQPSTLNGYVTTSTLEGYYTKSEVNGLIPDISGKADKSEMAVADNNNGTVTITLKSGTSATVLTSVSYDDLSDAPTNLSDFVNDMGFARNIYGRLTNGSFYKGTYSGGQWIYKNTAVTPETGVLYIDVADNVSYVWSGSAFVRVDEEQTETPSVTVSATGDVSQALNPNTFYRFGAVDSLDLTLVAGDGLVVYFGRFSTSANWGGTGLTVPSGVTEGTNNPTVEASKTYEFNIMDNVLLLMEV